jgi:DNA invertase Pin-like site-specific DNA recombinase
MTTTIAIPIPDTPSPVTPATAVYLRVSSDSQAERGTIQDQRVGVAPFVGTLGGAVEWFEDDGVSGMLELHERPAGARLLLAIRAGRVNRVIVHKLDRLGRGNDVRLLINTVYDLLDLGASVYIVDLAIDSATRAGRLTLQIMAELAVQSRVDMLERTAAGRLRAAGEGRYYSSTVPVGYAKGPEKKIIADEDPIEELPAYSRAGVIREIFARVLDGESLAGVAAALNAAGVPVRCRLKGHQRKDYQGTPWTKQAVWRVVTNPAYCGRHIYRAKSGKTVPVPMPALVDPDDWERAQQTFRGRRTGGPSRPQHAYLLRGLLRCGRCGRAWYGNAINFGGRQRVYYRCTSQCNRTAGVDWCQSPGVRIEPLEAKLWQDILAFLSAVYRHETGIAGVPPAPGSASVPASPLEREAPAELPDAPPWLACLQTPEQDALYDRARRERDGLLVLLAGYDDERRRAITTHTRGRCTEAELDSELDRIERERRATEARLADLAAVLAPPASAQLDADTIRQAAHLALTTTLDHPTKTALLRLLITSITLHVTGTPRTRKHRTATADIHYLWTTERFTWSV